MLRKNKLSNNQAERTRAWIFEALILLLDKKLYSKIAVSDITQKAGIARQTFYRNYDNKDDIILQFLNSSFNPNLIETKMSSDSNRDSLLIMFPLEQFIKHTSTMKKLLTSEVKYLIYDYVKEWEDHVVDRYKNRLSQEESMTLRYILKYLNGGSLRMISDWIRHDMPVSTEKMEEMLTGLTCPLVVQDDNIPKVIIRVGN